MCLGSKLATRTSVGLLQNNLSIIKKNPVSQDHNVCTFEHENMPLIILLKHIDKTKQSEIIYFGSMSQCMPVVIGETLEHWFNPILVVFFSEFFALQN